MVLCKPLTYLILPIIHRFSQMEDFQIYEKYCQNKPRSESLWRQCSDAAFFQVTIKYFSLVNQI